MPSWPIVPCDARDGSTRLDLKETRRSSVFNLIEKLLMREELLLFARTLTLHHGP